MPGGAAYLGSLALDRARNASEFVKAIEAWKLSFGEHRLCRRAGEHRLGRGGADADPPRLGWLAAGAGARRAT